MRFLNIFCDPKKAAIDVGANVGKFSEQLVNLCSHLYAYEPLPDLGKQLKQRFKANRNATVRVVALSNKNGTAVIHTPRYVNPAVDRDSFVLGWSSIAKDYRDLQKKYPDKFPVIKNRKIKTVKLDDEKIENVGFIKIDVEGFEYEVLQGAQKTITKNKPILLIELEERHRRGCIKRVASYLKRLGYSGYFFMDEKILPIDRFSIPKMQTGKVFPGPVDKKKYRHYIFNFVFLPSFLRNRMLKRIRERLTR